MRKTFYPVKLFVLFALIVFALSTFAATALAAPTHQAVFVIGQNSYTADGQEKTMDAAPFIENDRTYVPVRYLAYALGVAEKDVGWDGSTNTVTLKLGGITLKMVIGSKILYVNGQPKQMDVAPLIVLGRTYLPARWVAEAFGYEVKWDEKTQAVLVGPPGNVPEPPKPPVEPPKKLGENGPIDLTAAKNGTLGVPVNAVAPPSKWGFEPPIKRLGFEVSNRYATATRWDGSTFKVDLGAEAIIVCSSGLLDFVKQVHPNLVDKTVVWSEQEHLLALYVPFIPVAEAFGVPRGNIVWDGEHLGIWGYYGSVENYWVLNVGSKNVICKGYRNNTDVSGEQEILYYPLFAKDGVPMIGLGTGTDIAGIMFAPVGGYKLIDGEGGGNLNTKTGTAYTIIESRPSVYGSIR